MISLISSFLALDDSSNFVNSPSISVSARWSGETRDYGGTRFDEQEVSRRDSDDSSVFWVPDIVLSFAPRRDINGERRFRLFSGGRMQSDVLPGEFDSAGDRLPQRSASELASDFRNANMRWAYVVNDRLDDESCATLDRDSTAERFSELDSENNEHHGFNFNLSNEDDSESARFHRKKPISFAFSCLEPGRENKIEISWWTASEDERLDREVKKLEITLFFPEEALLANELADFEANESYKLAETPIIFRIQASDIDAGSSLSVETIATESLIISPRIDSNYTGGSRRLFEFFTLSHRIESDLSKIFSSFPFSLFKNEIHDLFRFPPFRVSAAVGGISNGYDTAEDLPLRSLFSTTDVDRQSAIFRSNSNDQTRSFPSSISSRRIVIENRFVWDSDSSDWVSENGAHGVQLGDPLRRSQDLELNSRVDIEGVWNYRLETQIRVHVENSFASSVGFQDLPDSLEEGVRIEREQTLFLSAEALETLAFDPPAGFWNDLYFDARSRNLLHNHG